MRVAVVFDGPPGPESGRFVEVENTEGDGFKVGVWQQRNDEYWSLWLDVEPFDGTANKDVEALMAVVHRLEEDLEHVEYHGGSWQERCMDSNCSYRARS